MLYSRVFHGNFAEKQPRCADDGIAGEMKRVPVAHCFRRQGDFTQSDFLGAECGERFAVPLYGYFVGAFDHLEFDFRLGVDGHRLGMGRLAEDPRRLAMVAGMDFQIAPAGVPGTEVFLILEGLACFGVVDLNGNCFRDRPAR